MKKISAFCLLLLLLGGCSWQKPKADIKSDIKIGAILSLTGDAAGYGEFARKAINLAAEEINSSGGVKGRNLKIIFEDDSTDSKNAVTAFRKLVDVDKVDGIIGGMWDFTAQPLLPLALDSNITFITPTNFRIDGSFEMNKNTFTMMPDFDKVLSLSESYITKENVKKLGVVRFASDFGQQITKTLKSIMEKQGGEIFDETYNDIGGNDFRTTILKLKDKGVDTVFLDMLDTDLISFLTRSKELNFTPKVISHPIALDLLNNDRVSNELINGITLINWEVQLKQFADNFRARYGIEPAKSADRSYDAVYVLATAIASDNDISTYIERNQFETIDGAFNFTANHTVENIPVKIQVIQDKKLVEYKN